MIGMPRYSVGEGEGVRVGVGVGASNKEAVGG